MYKSFLPGGRLKCRVYCRPGVVDESRVGVMSSVCCDEEAGHNYVDQKKIIMNVKKSIYEKFYINESHLFNKKIIITK